jgi:hypothetical protein
MISFSWAWWYMHYNPSNKEAEDLDFEANLHVHSKSSLPKNKILYKSERLCLWLGYSIHLEIFSSISKWLVWAKHIVTGCPHGFCFVCLFIFFIIHMLGSFLPPAPTPLPYHSFHPLPLPPPPQYPAETILPSFLILL